MHTMSLTVDLQKSIFEPGQWIPECQLIVAVGEEVVNLIGAKETYHFIYLTLNPEYCEGSYIQKVVFVVCLLVNIHIV